MKPFITHKKVFEGFVSEASCEFCGVTISVTERRENGTTVWIKQPKIHTLYPIYQHKSTEQ